MCGSSLRRPSRMGLFIFHTGKWAPSLPKCATQCIAHVSIQKLLTIIDIKIGARITHQGTLWSLVSQQLRKREKENHVTSDPSTNHVHEDKFTACGLTPWAVQAARSWPLPLQAPRTLFVTGPRRWPVCAAVRAEALCTYGSRCNPSLSGDPVSLYSS